VKKPSTRARRGDWTDAEDEKRKVPRQGEIEDSMNP
jgi:hypothetical protein